MMAAGLLLRCFSAAMAGAKAVAVSYEDLAPASFTIDDAISNGSFFQYDRSIVTGDVDAALAAEGVQVRVFCVHDVIYLSCYVLTCCRFLRALYAMEARSTFTWSAMQAFVSLVKVANPYPSLLLHK